MPEKAGPVGLHRLVQEIKQALTAEGYECFTGTADLCVYFFECGVRLLRPAGTLAYISSNSFLNSGFGENLRRYLSANTRIQQLIDFAETTVFEAITGPCVICLTRDNAAGHDVKFLKGDPSTPPERIREASETRSQTIQQSGIEVTVLAVKRRTGKPYVYSSKKRRVTSVTKVSLLSPPFNILKERIRISSPDGQSSFI